MAVPYAFQLEAFAPVPPGFALDFLCDFNNQRQLHPYFEHSRLLGTDAGPDGVLIEHHQVVERPPFGPFRPRLLIDVKLRRLPDYTAELAVSASLATRLQIRYQCIAEGAGTRILEHTEIRAPFFTLPLVARKGHHAHREAFTRLPAALVAAYARAGQAT